MSALATPEDRAAAWPFRADCYGHRDKTGWMAGRYDHNRAIQAFVAHRLAALDSRAGDAGEAREEAAHLITIDQRDAAEAALSDAYRAVCGREPTWSNNFSYEDAVREMRKATTPAPAVDAVPAGEWKTLSHAITLAKRNLALTQGCMECNAADEQRWQDTIAWLEGLA